MAETLSFGYLNPEVGDSAKEWQDAINPTIQQLNDHTHDGIDSSTISPASITKFSTAILSGNWVSDGGGNFSQVVTAPPQVTEVNDFYIKTHNTANGDVLYPSVERVTAGSFRVRVNDNSLDITAIYL